MAKISISRRRLSLESLESRMVCNADFTLLMDTNPVNVSPQRPMGIFPIGNEVGISYGESDLDLWLAESTRNPQPTYVTTSISPASNAVSLPLGNRTLFLGTDDVHSEELWATDGTPEGTYLLHDFVTRSPITSVSSLIELDGVAYFYADEFERRMIWRTDGTPSGTTPIEASGRTSNFIPSGPLAKMGNELYYTTTSFLTGKRFLAKYSPSTDVVTIIQELSVGSTLKMLAINDRLLIEESHGLLRTGTHLYAYSAAEGLVELLAPSNGILENFKILGDRAFIEVSDYGMWTTDGTVAGTKRFLDDSIQFYLSEFAPENEMLIDRIGDRFLFVAASQFHISDGSIEGTVNLGIEWAGHPFYTRIQQKSGNFYFHGKATSGKYYLYELNPLSSTPRPIYEMQNPFAIFNFAKIAMFPAVVNDRLFFTDGIGGKRLLFEYQTDTKQVVQVVKDTGTEGGDQRFLSSMEDGTIWFASSNNKDGLRLWQTDGTSSGTSPISVVPMTDSLERIDLAQVIDGALIFEAQSSGSVNQIARYSLEPTSKLITKLATLSSFGRSKIEVLPASVIQLRVDSSGELGIYRLSSDLKTDERIISLPTPLSTEAIPVTVSGDRILFRIGGQLWQSNGTAEGTALVFPADSPEFFDEEPIVDGARVLLVSRQRNVYRYDSDLNSASLLGTFRQDITALLPQFGQSRFISLNNQLIFFGTSGGIMGAWVFDTSSQDTYLLRVLGNGSEIPSPQFTGKVNGKVVWLSPDEKGAAVLWSTDGYVGGTQRIYYSQLSNFEIPYLYRANRVATLPDGRLLVSLPNGSMGRELWITDGTSEGTRLFSEIEPNTRGSDPRVLVAGSNIVAFADTLKKGRLEPFAYNFENYAAAKPNDQLHFYVTDGMPEVFIGFLVLPDIAPANVRSYRLEGTSNKDRFVLYSEIGQLQLAPNASFDYETNPTESITVLVEYVEEGSTLIRTRMVQVTMDVVDSVEAPKIEDQEFEIFENIPMGTYLDTLKFFSEPGHPVAFTQTAGFSFGVGSITGNIYQGNAVNYEQMQSAIITIELRDEVTKQKDTAKITFRFLDVDEAPVLTSLVPNEIAFSGRQFSKVFSLGQFVDPEGLPVIYSMTMADGTNLPPWISFDPSTRTLLANPGANEIGSHALRLVASDPAGHTASVDFQLLVLNGELPWYNLFSPMDVNRDDRISPLDALLVINYINLVGSGTLPPENVDQIYFYDSNGDGKATPLDALLIINDLNMGVGGEGEGEGDGEWVNKSLRRSKSFGGRNSVR